MFSPVGLLVHHRHTEPEEGRRGFRTLGIGATDGYEQSCRYWESNPCPLEEQSVQLRA